MARSKVSAAAGAGLFWVDGRCLRGSALALLLLVLSAFALIESTHECRQLYGKLQRLEAAHWNLEENYSRLLLEQSTWASHYRVRQVAERDLSMTAPAVDALQVLAR